MDISKITPNDITYDIKDEVSEEEIEAIKAYIGYVPENVVGLLADFENSTFTRLGGAVGKTAGSDFNVFNMYGNRKVCALQDDGTVSKWYGEEGYVEDGSIGQIMVRQPKFYYKVVPLKLEPITNGEGYHLRKAAYYISDDPLPGFKVHPAFIGHDGTEKDCYYIGSYEASLWDESEQEYRKYDTWDVTYDAESDTYTVNALNTYLADATADKLCSISGVKPASGDYSTYYSALRIHEYADNRGINWEPVAIRIHSSEQFLMFIEYGKFNMQLSLGAGVSNLISGSHNESVFTGSTSYIGNGSGNAITTNRINGSGNYEVLSLDGQVSVRYRGVENYWGNMASYICGINCKGFEKNNIVSPSVYICDDYDFSIDKYNGNYKRLGFICPLSIDGNYITSFGYDTEYDWLFIPSDASANSNIPIGDLYISGTYGPTTQSIVTISSWWNRTSWCGPFYCGINTRSGSGTRFSRFSGSRLTYID